MRYPGADNTRRKPRHYNSHPRRRSGHCSRRAHGYRAASSSITPGAVDQADRAARRNPRPDGRQRAVCGGDCSAPRHAQRERKRQWQPLALRALPRLPAAASAGHTRPPRSFLALAQTTAAHHRGQCARARRADRRLPPVRGRRRRQLQAGIHRSRPARQGRSGAGRRGSGGERHEHPADAQLQSDRHDPHRTPRSRRCMHGTTPRSGCRRCRASPTATSRCARARTTSRIASRHDGCRRARRKEVTDLDQLFNTLDPKTRKGLQEFIQGSAEQYAGASRAAWRSRPNTSARRSSRHRPLLRPSSSATRRCSRASSSKRPRRSRRSARARTSSADLIENHEHDLPRDRLRAAAARAGPQRAAR